MSAESPTRVAARPGQTTWDQRFFPKIAWALATLLVAGALFIGWRVRQVDRDLRDDLLGLARLAAGAMNMEDILSLSGSEADLENPVYLDLKRQLTAIHQAHGRSRFLYLLGQHPDGSVFFLMDSEPPDSQDYSPPGQAYEEASADLLRVFSTATALVEGPESDRWGTWVSALVPLRDPRIGRVTAVLGMDLDARHWHRIVLARAAWPSVLTAMLVAVLMLSYALALSRRLSFDDQAMLRQNREYLAQAVTETERQRRLLETLLDAIPAPVFFKDKDGLYLGCNPAFEVITGKKEDDILGKRPYDLWPAQFSQTYRDEDLDLLQTGGKQQYEYQYVGPDGGERDVVFYKAAFRDQAGNVDGLVGVMLDITDRKKVENELLLLKQAMEQASEMIIIVDPEGTMQYVNPAFERVTGYSRQEAVGQNPRILKSGRQEPDFYKNLWETITAGGTWQGRMINRRKDGTFYNDESSIAPVHDGGGRVVNFVAVKRDMTEHIRMTAQLQQAKKMETIGRLAGGVAHEFNNMLNVIEGHAELTLDELGPEHPLRESLEEILDAARRSAGITRQLLAFARRQTIRPEVLDLNATLGGMLKILRRLIGEDIDLGWEPGPGLWTVRMDPSQVDQVLAILLVNARDAIAGPGKVVISTENVSLRKEDCIHLPGMVPGEFVRLSVSDSGRGMDRATLDNLFEPFFTTKGVGEGAGLGMATVYGIVKQNHGFIYPASRPGHGATFTIFFPRHTGRTEPDRGSEAAKDRFEGGQTMLVVEDEASVLRLVKRILERRGYVVLTADGPSSAIKLAEEHEGRIHLLITDLIMPEMNGRDLAGRLQARHPGLAVLYMSGYTADAIGRQGEIEADMHFIQKPFSSQALADKVREALED